MKPLKVLSIDWDYFINATAEQRCSMFPDGGNENLPPFVQNLVWQTHYGNSDLENIGVNMKAFKAVTSMLEKTLNSSTQVFVADSHRHIYNTIHQEYEEKGCYDGLELVNIDFHHDYFGMRNSDQVDCGNWVNALFDEADESSPLSWCNNLDKLYIWVCCEDSLKSSELDEKPWFNYGDLKHIGSSKQAWDIIFICRSSMWSPPHLDKKFLSLCKSVVNWDVFVKVKEMLPNRYNKEFSSSVEEHRKQIQALFTERDKQKL